MCSSDLNRDAFRPRPINDSEDCVMLEVLNVAPISFAYPTPSIPVESGAQAASGKGKGVTRKRAMAGPSDSKAAERAAKKQRVVKKPGVKKKPVSNA